MTHPQSFRWLLSLLPVCGVALLLSGCFRGLYDGDWSLLRPGIFRYTTTTDEPKPPVAGIAPGPVGEEVNGQLPVLPAGPAAAPQLTSFPLREAMPAVLTAPAAPPEKQSPAASPPRVPAPAAKADFFYGDQVLVEDTVWHGVVEVAGVVTVAPQATLTIEPGTVVRFGTGTGGAPGGSLLVQGRIIGNGTGDRPLLFTSRFARPMKGDWPGIVLLGTEKKNVLQNCRLEGAETGLDASFSTITLAGVSFADCGTGLCLQDAIASVTGGGATGCDLGMSITDSEADLRDSVFTGNGRGIVSERGSIYMTGGKMAGTASVALRAEDSRLKVVGTIFTGNGDGIALESSQGSVSGCTVSDNTGNGMALVDSRMRVYGNSFSKNGAGLRVEGGTGAAWGNIFADNGKYDIVNAGDQDFRASGNWWGGVAAAEVGRRLCDRQVDGWRGRILYQPVLPAKPGTMQ